MNKPTTTVTATAPALAVLADDVLVADGGKGADVKVDGNKLLDQIADFVDGIFDGIDQASR